MPGRKKASRAPRSRSPAKPRAVAIATASHALLVIDHERLHDAAWAEFHTVRKRLDKAARELHRHEEIDMPAYDAWLHRTFPLDVTALRELTEEVTAKARRIQLVQARAAHTGRSLKRLWQEEKERAANPEAFREKTPPEHEADAEGDGDDASEGRRYDVRREDFEDRPAPNRAAAARDIYRRLVQRLHPDRGGDWSPARQHLWHEIQQAWKTGDADWLARLEIEWETAHEEIGPKSPLSRLRAAIEELHAARRDIEHKLAEYRTSLPWRFTRTETRRMALERRVKAGFAHDFRVLRRQLNHLDAMIASWEEDWMRAKTRPHRKWHRPSFRRPGRKI
jgi:hypothetical protein